MSCRNTELGKINQNMTWSQLPMKVDEANLCYGDGLAV